MITTLFLGFVLLMAAVVFALVARYLGLRTAFIVICALSLWFVYVGVLGYSGVIRNTTLRPPGAVYLFGPVVLFLLYFLVRVRSSTAVAFPLWALLGAQTFRVIVELFLHQLWIDGLVPKMLTFAGANVDIYVGASAPLIAWLSTRGQTGAKIALGWNVLGLLALANVVVRAVGTSPGPLNLIHAEVPNLMVGTFPYMFIPGFFVPLAVVLHVLALKKLFERPRTLAH